VYTQTNRARDALDLYQRTIVLDPQSALTHTGLGDAFCALGEYDQAIAAYKRAIRLDRNYAGAYAGLGRAYWAIGRPFDALTAYERALQRDKNNARALVGAGTFYLSQDEKSKAEATFRQAIIADPGYAMAYAGLGNLYRELGRLAEAKTMYLKACDMNPQKAAYFGGLGDICHALGEYDEAVAAYQKAIAINPGDAFSRAALAGIYKKSNQMEAYETEIALARQLIQRASKYDQACFESISGNTDLAINLLRAALLQSPVQKEWARRDPDFVFIRQDPRFQELVGQEPELTGADDAPDATAHPHFMSERGVAGGGYKVGDALYNRAAL
jgi:tetratricopeptide (TPR) repeat protein